MLLWHFYALLYCVVSEQFEKERPKQILDAGMYIQFLYA